MNSPVPRRGRGGTLSQVVVDDLLEKIRAGQLSVGDQLPPQQQLAVEYSVGASVIRDAMQQLSAMGLIDVRPRRGAVITAVEPSRALDEELLAVLLDTAAIDEIFALRRLIATEIAGLAAENATAEQVSALERIHEKFGAARVAGSPVQDLDVQFHHALAEAAGNSVFLGIYQRLAGVMDAVRRPALSVGGAAEVAEREHRDVLDALLARDGDRARAAMARHSDTSAAASRAATPPQA